jgi:hypothetical protein
MAIDAGVPVQAVDYAKLAARLVNDGQILRMPAPPPKVPGIKGDATFFVPGSPSRKRAG